MFCVMPYFASTPMSPPDRRQGRLRYVIGGQIADRVRLQLEVARERAAPPCRQGWRRARREVGAAHAEAPADLREVGNLVLPLVRARAWKPQSCTVPGAYRIDLNGIAASIVQPPSTLPAARLQTGFQSALYCRSLVLWPSVRAAERIGFELDRVATIAERVEREADRVALANVAAVAPHLVGDRPAGSLSHARKLT
jgi:hypothetical protein